VELAPALVAVAADTTAPAPVPDAMTLEAAFALLGLEPTSDLDVVTLAYEYWLRQTREARTTERDRSARAEVYTRARALIEGGAPLPPPPAIPAEPPPERRSRSGRERHAPPPPPPDPFSVLGLARETADAGLARAIYRHHLSRAIAGGDTAAARALETAYARLNAPDT
jgi:hypothetical protein